MKIAIITFSPSGHSLKAAEIIKKRCQEHSATVKLINLTGQHDLLFEQHRKENLREALGEYDLLFIGGPIYAGHMERNILNAIKNLPKPDATHSNLVVPYATYGGAHSSVALEEMGTRLKKKKYKSILGIKIAAEHTLTATFSKVMNPGKPDKEEEEIIYTAVDRAFSICSKGRKQAVDQSKSFKYTPLKWRMVLKFATQEKIHGKFKQVKINADKCQNCKRCILKCPVNMFYFKDNKVQMAMDNERCILCAECYHVCPFDAIEHSYMDMAKKRLQDGHAPMEACQTAIYPSE